MLRTEHADKGNHQLQELAEFVLRCLRSIPPGIQISASVVKDFSLERRFILIGFFISSSKVLARFVLTVEISVQRFKYFAKEHFCQVISIA